MPALRVATEVIEVPDRRPVAGSIAMTLSPDQNDPKLRHHRPCGSTIEVGVDRVVVARAVGADDQAAVGPGAGVAAGAGGQVDAGVRAAEGRGRVVQVVLAVAVGEVRRPQVAGGVGRGPRGAVRERRARVAPGGAVRGGLQRDAAARGRDQVGAVGSLDDRRVVRPRRPGDDPGRGVRHRRTVVGVVDADQRWLSRPLQVHSATGVPLAVREPVTSTHRPDCCWTMRAVRPSGELLVGAAGAVPGDELGPGGGAPARGRRGSGCRRRCAALRRPSASSPGRRRRCSPRSGWRRRGWGRCR